MVVVAAYVLFVVYLLIRGENTIGKMAEKLVPVMCVAYLIGTIIILLLNITNLPSMFVGIFKGALTGTAAVGGFAGSAVALTVRQGLWGSVEGFCDTIIVCTCSGLAILATGTWTSGTKGAAE